MSDRPRFEPEVERVLREALEKDSLEGLPGAGKPLPGAGERDDPLWWVRSWVRRDRGNEEE